MRLHDILHFANVSIRLSEVSRRILSFRKPEYSTYRSTLPSLRRSRRRLEKPYIHRSFGPRLMSGRAKLHSADGTCIHPLIMRLTARARALSETLDAVWQSCVLLQASLLQMAGVGRRLSAVRGRSGMRCVLQMSEGLQGVVGTW